MIITYHGIECFKISQGDVTLVFNPISKDSKFRSTNFSADVTLITTDLPDLNGREQTSRGDKTSFIVEGPGEYEVKDIFIKGFASTGPIDKINTIYLVYFEGMRLCFLGALKDPSLSNEMLESLEDIDILFVPVGGWETLDPQAAYKLAVSLEPRIIIPMHYDKSSLSKFTKEGGHTEIEPIAKFVVRKKDLEGKEGEIVILNEE